MALFSNFITQSLWEKTGVIMYQLRKKSYQKNPGIQKRLAILSDNMKSKDENFDEEDFEKFETDFMNSREIYESHQREVLKMKKKVEFKQTERAYFNTVKNPNLLTWAEKEQIKNLHENDPDIWTPEKLSESFPTTSSIIQKILKSKWTPENVERVARHDKIVSRNWKNFQSGKLTICDKELSNHLRKFTSREDYIAQNPSSVALLENSTINDDGNTEFSRIISLYKEKLKTEKNTDQANGMLEELHNPKKINYMKFRKHYTLDELRKQVHSSLSESKPYNREDEHFLYNAENQTLPVKKIGKEEILHVKAETGRFHHSSSNDLHNKGDEKNVEEDSTYPSSIIIPKEKWKDNSTYKFKDCFYDSNGEFLYRVPGLVNSRQ